MDTEQIKFIVKYGLIIVFGGLVVYGAVTGAISGDNIVGLFKDVAEIK